MHLRKTVGGGWDIDFCSMHLTPYNTLDGTSSRGLSHMWSLLVTCAFVCSAFMRRSWARLLTLGFALCRLLLRLAQSLLLDFATLGVLAGDLVIERPATELAEICRQLPDLWRQACDESSHTCLPRVILAPDLPAEVTVRFDGRSMTLPNIHRQLLLLTHLQPCSQHRGAWGAPADCGGGSDFCAVFRSYRCVACVAIEWGAALAMGMFESAHLSLPGCVACRPVVSCLGRSSWVGLGSFAALPRD